MTVTRIRKGYLFRKFPFTALDEYPKLMCFAAFKFYKRSLSNYLIITTLFLFFSFVFKINSGPASISFGTSCAQAILVIICKTRKEKKN